MNVTSLLKSTYRGFTRRAVYCGDYRVLTGLRSGLKMYVDSRDLSVTPYLVMHGNWEPATTKQVLRHVKPNMRVVDVGANVGYYSLLMAKAIGPKGRLVSFEANPLLAELVQANLAINGFALGSGISTVVAKAVSNFTGETQFTFFDKYKGGGTVHDIAPQAGDASNRHSVPCVKLDDALSDFGQVDFIKMDAEGAEQLILTGARRTIENSPNLKMIVEFQPEKSLYEIVSDYGFSVAPILGNSIREASFSELQKIGICDALLTKRKKSI